MRKAIIQELHPKTSIEGILVNEYVNAQFSEMRYRTWQAAVMQFSVGVLEAGSQKSVAQRQLPLSTITPLKLRCTCLDEARWTASIKGNSVLNVAGIHRRASWNRGEAVSKRRPRKSRELSLTRGNASNLRLLKWRPLQEKMTRVMLLTEDRGIRTIAEISGKAE
jgi:hypothetical protein